MATSAEPSQNPDHPARKTVCLIIMGKAGVGKTTFVQRLTEYLTLKDNAPYVVNLDPACLDIPYPVNIDIRQTVNYKEVKQQYSMGPNGAIVTSLNLFTTTFNQVMDIINKRAPEYEFIIFDTPGQLEVFHWSASGSIITEALASNYPTVIIFLMDAVRCHNPNTFLANMLYVCSVMFKHKLPILAIMNKTDIIKHDYALEWIQDFTLFRDAILDTSTYHSTLNSTLCLALDDLYQNLNIIGLSSLTGESMQGLFPALRKAVDEYYEDFKPIYDRLRTNKQMTKVPKINPALKGEKAKLFIHPKHALEESDEDSEEDIDEQREEVFFKETLEETNVK